MKKRIIIAIMCIVLGIFAVACSKGGNAGKTNDSSASSTTQPAPITTQADKTEAVDKTEPTQAEEKEVVDFIKVAESYFVSEAEALKAYGLEKTGMSVIALAWTDNIYLVDGAANIAALPDNHHIPEDILEKYPSFTDHDGKLDYAKIEELAPEVIIASAKDLENDASLKEIVDKLDIKVVQTPECKTYDDVLKTIATASIVFGGDQDVAKDNIAAYLERVEDAKALGEGNDKRNVAVIMVTKDGEFLLGTDGFANSLITKLELKNVAANMEMSGEVDQFGFYTSPGMDKIAEAKPDSLVLMVRMRGEPEARQAACDNLIDSIKESFGEDSDLVKNERYEIVDHHGLIAVCPITISGLENIASIAFE